MLLLLIKIFVKMAVEASRVKARLRALFPKANLATKRLDEISDKLGKKIEDNATDAQIDESLSDQNELYSFEDMARNDDRERTERAKSKEVKPTQASEKKEDDSDDVPSWAKSLINEIQTLKEEKKQTSISERFKKDERLKGIPEFVVNMAVPKDEESIEDAITNLVDNFKTFAEKAKLADYGKDTPAGGDKKPAGKVKEISAEEAKALVQSM